MSLAVQCYCLLRSAVAPLRIVGSRCLQIGNILVATRDLPKGYRFVYWGTRVTGKAKAAVMKTDDRLIECAG